MNKLKRILIFIFSVLPLTAMAQDGDLEYRWDVGGGASLVFPITDAVGFMSSVNMGFGAVARRQFNARMALRTNMSFLHASGTTKGFLPVDPNSGTPEGGIATGYSWTRNMVEMCAVGELNFWGYGSGPRYKGNKRITPYILAGLGVGVMFGGSSATGALLIPLGAGVKYRVAPRLNLGFEWRFTFTTTDRMEGIPQLDDPLGIESSGLKNKDQYSTMMVTLTYDISPKLRKCNN